MDHPHDPFRATPDPRTLHPAAPPSTAPDGATGDHGRGRRRRYAAIGVTAGLLGGGAVGAMLGAPSSSAMSGTPLLVQPDAGPADATDTRSDPGSDDSGTNGSGTNGSGTNEARDRAGCDDGGRGAIGGRPGRLGVAAFDGRVVADLIGVDLGTLREQLRAGSSLAEIAEANGVDAQTLIDALVAEASGHLDLAVENGRLTEDEASERLAEITERIGERVEAVPGEMRPGRIGRGGPWDGEHDRGASGRDGSGEGGTGDGAPSEVPSDD